MDNPKYNDLLNAAFNNERIVDAKMRDLKKYLLACIEMRETEIPNPIVREGLPKRTEYIRELISIKMKEQEAWRGNLAIVISIFALIASGLKQCVPEAETCHKATEKTTSQKTSQQPKP